MFQSIQTLSVENAIKSVFYALNGVKGTEENPAFLDEVKKVSERASEWIAVQKNRGLAMLLLTFFHSFRFAIAFVCEHIPGVFWVEGRREDVLHV